MGFSVTAFHLLAILEQKCKCFNRGTYDQIGKKKNRLSLFFGSLAVTQRSWSIQIRAGLKSQWPSSGPVQQSLPKTKARTADVSVPEIMQGAEAPSRVGEDRTGEDETGQERTGK